MRECESTHTWILSSGHSKLEAHAAKTSWWKRAVYSWIVFWREGFTTPMFGLSLVILIRPWFWHFCWLPCCIRRYRKVEMYTRKGITGQIKPNTFTADDCSAWVHMCWGDHLCPWDATGDFAPQWAVFSYHRGEFKDADIPWHSILFFFFLFKKIGRISFSPKALC